MKRFKKPEIWKLQNPKEKGEYIEAEMDAELFDKLTKDHIIIEIDGKQHTYLNTPLGAYLVKRKA